jgi:hypothetical protein
MDPLTLIVAALTAGAVGGAGNVASTAVGDAYQGLKRLVAARFSGKKAAEVALAEHETDPEVWRAPLEKALSDSGASTDRDVIAAAQRLMELLDKAGSIAGKYTVTLHNTYGNQIGDGNSQVNVISAQSPARSSPEVPEATSADLAEPEPARPYPAGPVVGRTSSVDGLVPARPHPVRAENPVHVMRPGDIR